MTRPQALLLLMLAAVSVTALFYEVSEGAMAQSRTAALAPAVGGR